MDTLSYKTISANKATVTKEWVIVDATDQTLGRLGAKVAKLLRGKYKPNFTPHVDCGDNVIIINADKVKLTGNKWNDRVYLSYTGYPGGQREMTPARLITKPNGEERLLKQIDILEYHRDMTHQTFRIYFIHREITKKNTSFLWVIKTGAKFHYCTFSTSGRTDKGSQ